MDELNIRFNEHKPIPLSSKISDIYLDDYDVWIEIDGIDREKRIISIMPLIWVFKKEPSRR